MLAQISRVFIRGRVTPLYTLYNTKTFEQHVPPVTTVAPCLSFINFQIFYHVHALESKTSGVSYIYNIKLCSFKKESSLLKVKKGAIKSHTQNKRPTKVIAKIHSITKKSIWPIN
jgi:hypothetical protein